MQRSAYAKNASKNFRILGFALMATLLTVVQSAFGATINVPGDQPNLQAAANVAVAGDVVLVAAGTHIGHATFTVPVTVTSSSATPPFPVIDGQIRLSAVGGSFTVSNLQVSNTTDNAFVHGVHVINSTNATVLVQNCILSANFQDGVRGDSNGLTLTVRNCTINDNLQRGVRYDGNYNGGPTQGANVLVDGCNIFNNGLANALNNNNRGRCVEMVDNQNGSLTVINSDLTVTQDGSDDRAIQFDNGNLDGTSITVENCNIIAPIYNHDLLTGNRNGLGIRVIGEIPSVTIQNCNLVGFRETTLIRTLDLPCDIVVRNCNYTDYTGITGGGTALYLERVKGGSILIENVSLIGFAAPLKATGGGNEALKIRDCDGSTVVVRNVETANTEEAFTIDRNVNFTMTIENSIANAGVYEGQQGFKFVENATSTFTVTDSMAIGWDDALDLGGTNVGNGAGPGVSVSFDGTTFIGNDQVDYTPGFANYDLSLTYCTFLQNLYAVQVRPNAGVPNGTVLVSNCTIHDCTLDGVLHGANSNAAVDIEYNIFSEWGAGAIRNAAPGGSITERFNVFVDESGNDRFVGAQLALIVEGGGSKTAAGLLEVYCDLEPTSGTYLNIRGDGPAALIDGNRDAGSKLACLVPASVETWELYE